MSVPEVDAPALGSDWAATKTSLKAQLCDALNAFWPTFATTVDVTLSDGTQTKLDPLHLGSLARGGGGPCPWACGAVDIKTVNGLASATVTEADAALTLRSCNGAAIVIVAPLVIADLEVDAEVNVTVLGLKGAWPSAAVRWRGVRGTLTVNVPFVLDPTFHPFLAPGGKFVTNWAGAAVELVVDVNAASSTASTPSWALPLVNDALRAGGADALQRLAQTKLSPMLTSQLVTHLGPNGWNWGPIEVPSAWINGILDTIVEPSSCALVLNPTTKRREPTTFALPCDPCDFCCACATQGRCADDACVRECGACMPLACKRQLPLGLMLGAGGVVLATLVVVVALLVALGVGIAHAVKRPSAQRRSTR